MCIDVDKCMYIYIETYDIFVHAFDFKATPITIEIGEQGSSE